MTTYFLSSFLRDVRKVRDARIRGEIALAIEAVEAAPSLGDLSQFKWLAGYPSYGRIRVGEWRLGILVKANAITFVRCLHRREVYRYFP